MPALPSRISASILRLLEVAEDGIHLLVAGLLVGVALVLIVDVVNGLVAALRGPHEALPIVFTMLDKSLVLFIVAELPHTVRLRSGIEL